MIWVTNTYHVYDMESRGSSKWVHMCDRRLKVTTIDGIILYVWYYIKFMMPPAVYGTVW
jgi:hypothetical protein